MDGGVTTHSLRYCPLDSSPATAIAWRIHLAPSETALAKMVVMNHPFMTVLMVLLDRNRFVFIYPGVDTVGQYLGVFGDFANEEQNEQLCIAILRVLVEPLSITEMSEDTVVRCFSRMIFER